MGKKPRKNLKKKLLLDERDVILNDVATIDAILNGEIDINDIEGFTEKVFTKISFVEAVEWLKPFIEESLSGIQSKLDSLTNALEKEFPNPKTIQEFQSDQKLNELQIFNQTKAVIIVKLHLDSSLVLYALGKHGAAIIELHGVLERQAIEKLSRIILSPEKVVIGRKILERLTLKDLAPLLQECNILDKEDIKFVEKLSKLRNGLAHKNPKVISNAILSGKSLSDVEIDSVLSELDYISYTLKAIRFLIKIMDWYEDGKTLY